MRLSKWGHYIRIEINVEVRWQAIKDRFTPSNTRALRAFEAHVATWPKRMKDWDEWQALERMSDLGSYLNFTQMLRLFTYRAEADLKRDFRRQMWGSGKLGHFLGLDVLTSPIVPRDKAYLIAADRLDALQYGWSGATGLFKGYEPTYVVMDEVSEYGLTGETVGHEFDDEPTGLDIINEAFSEQDADFERKYDHRYEEWHDMGGDA